MLQFAAGVVVGIVVATVGFNGVATIADKGVDATKQVVQEAAKK